MIPWLADFATSCACGPLKKQAIFFRIVESLGERINGLITRASEESVSTKLSRPL